MSQRAIPKTNSDSLEQKYVFYRPFQFRLGFNRLEHGTKATRQRFGDGFDLHVRSGTIAKLASLNLGRGNLWANICGNDNIAAPQSIRRLCF